MDEFCKLIHGEETILSCGHRYHHHCLRHWEVEQCKNNPYIEYKCPLCQQHYTWREKYIYTYTIGYQ